VSIKQKYYGHSRQAGIQASQMVPVATGNRWTIVVMKTSMPRPFRSRVGHGTRCDPKEDLEIMIKCWSSKIDPLTFDEKYYNSRVVVDACKPTSTGTIFSPVAETSAELKARMLAKYPEQFREILGEF
jgi:4-hydroxy-3-polyprenylbenzoate decarboxylase